jgi:hypothetical protein
MKYFSTEMEDLEPNRLYYKRSIAYVCVIVLCE